MLKQRIITALILIPIVIATILFAPFALFTLAVTAVFSLAIWEWALLGKCGTIVKICYLLVCLLCVGALCGVSNELHDDVLIFDILTICWWLCIAVAVIVYPKAKNIFASKVVLLIAGIFTLVPAWHGLLVCFNHNRESVLGLLAISIIADTGAYFSGKYFGKTLLAPQVSPKKTIEGLAGAVILGVAITSLFLIINHQSFKLDEIVYPLLAIVCLVLVSSLGDLWESLVKRVHNVKDSGNILPGHGGVLDRIDSHIAVFSLFPVCYRIIEYF